MLTTTCFLECQEALRGPLSTELFFRCSFFLDILVGFMILATPPLSRRRVGFLLILIFEKSEDGISCIEYALNCLSKLYNHLRLPLGCGNACTISDISIQVDDIAVSIRLPHIPELSNMS